MKYNTKNTIDINKPIVVYDANGSEIKYCIECDTETGQASQLKVRPDGSMITINEEPVISEGTFPAPLRVELA